MSDDDISLSFSFLFPLLNTHSHSLQLISHFSPVHLLQLRQYVSAVKMKAATFRTRKSELSEIHVERGLMAHTQDLLQEKANHVNEILTLLEEEKGITGYFAMQEEEKRKSPGNSKGSETRVDSMEDLTLVIKKLNEEISAKKAALAPFVKDLRPMRQKAYDLESECDKKKSVYDATAAGLESKLQDLEQEVNRMRDECDSLESRESRGKCDREVLSG